MAEALEVASPQKLLLGLLFKDLRGSYERSLLRIYGRSYEGRLGVQGLRAHCEASC